MSLSGGWRLPLPGQKRAVPRAEPEPEAMTRALTDAYEKHAVGIYRFAYRRLGNRPDAEDVTAQVFLKASRGLDPSFNDDARRAWLYRAARTAIVDVWRSYGETTVVPLEWYVEEPPPPLAGPASDAPTRVEKILAQLNATQRRVLELRFLESRSLLETAAELGLTEANVKVVQHRALRRAAELDREKSDGRLVD